MFGQLAAVRRQGRAASTNLKDGTAAPPPAMGLDVHRGARALAPGRGSPGEPGLYESVDAAIAALHEHPDEVTVEAPLHKPEAPPQKVGVRAD
jgi:hypothetical protein